MDELVHIWMVTYNHEKYIAKAIESVLMQKTNFKYKLIIGEDCSTDRTREIVKDYAGKYPDKIKANLNETNMGALKNAIQVFKACTAKYIALLEGDDYWTDPYKLQKQVDFLEANNDFSVCFHYVDTVDETGYTIKINSIPRYHIYDKRTFLLYKQETATCSMVFRKEFLEQPFPKWFHEVFAADKFLKLLLLEKGKGYVLPENMACLRFHRKGIHSGLGGYKKQIRKNQDLKILVDKFGSKINDILPILKAKQEFDFFPYYLKNIKIICALKSFIKMIKYPKYFFSVLYIKKQEYFILLKRLTTKKS